MCHNLSLVLAPERAPPESSVCYSEYFSYFPVHFAVILKFHAMLFHICFHNHTSFLLLILGQNYHVILLGNTSRSIAALKRGFEVPI